MAERYNWRRNSFLIPWKMSHPRLYRKSHSPIRKIIVIFAPVMTARHMILMAFFALLWIALAWVMLAYSGVTLYNLLWVGVSGGIIFVPLYKKWKQKD